MNTALTNIMNKLNEVFAPLDARILEQHKSWVMERRSSLYDFLRSDEYKDRSIDYTTRIKKAWEIAGGKTWYNAIYGNDNDYILSFVTKNCEAIAKKRNTSIANKLEKAGIIDIISEEFVMSSDGFNGIFQINTDKGIKTVTIETIFAGGYNIQCAHLRVLTRVK